MQLWEVARWVCEVSTDFVKILDNDSKEKGKDESNEPPNHMLSHNFFKPYFVSKLCFPLSLTLISPSHSPPASSFVFDSPPITLQIPPLSWDRLDFFRSSNHKNIILKHVCLSLGVMSCNRPSSPSTNIVFFSDIPFQAIVFKTLHLICCFEIYVVLVIIYKEGDVGDSE